MHCISLASHHSQPQFIHVIGWPHAFRVAGYVPPILLLIIGFWPAPKVYAYYSTTHWKNSESEPHRHIQQMQP